MADTQACTYAALVLHDAGSAITSEKIAAVIAAAGVEVRPTLPVLYARYLQTNGIDKLIAKAAAAPSAGGAAPAPVAAAAAAAAAPAPGGKKDDKKAKKAESEDDGDMGMGLFD